MGVHESSKTKINQPENPFEEKKRNAYSLKNNSRQNFGKVIDKYKINFPYTNRLTIDKNYINNKFKKLKSTTENNELYNSKTKNLETRDSTNIVKELKFGKKNQNTTNNKRSFKTKKAIKINKKPSKTENFKYLTNRNSIKFLNINDVWRTDNKSYNFTHLKNANKFVEDIKEELDNNKKNNEIIEINNNLNITNTINKELKENLLKKEKTNSEEDLQKDCCSNKENDNLVNNSNCNSNLCDEKAKVKMNISVSYQSCSESDYNSNDRLCPNANYKVVEKISDEYRSESESCSKNTLKKEEINNNIQNTKKKEVQKTENNDKNDKNNNTENLNNKKEDNVENCVKEENSANMLEKINDIDERVITFINNDNDNYEDEKMNNKDQNNKERKLNEGKLDGYVKNKNEQIKKKIENIKEDLNEYKNRSNSQKNSLNKISIEKIKNKKKLIINNKTYQNIRKKNQNNLKIINRNHSKNVSKDFFNSKNIINKIDNKTMQKGIFIKTVRKIFEKIKNDNSKPNQVKKNTVKNSFHAEEVNNNIKESESTKRKTKRSMFSSSVLKYIKTETNDSLNTNRNTRNKLKNEAIKFQKAKTTLKDYNDVIIYRNRKFNRTKKNSRKQSPYIHLNSYNKNSPKSNSNKKILRQNYTMKAKKINGKKGLKKKNINIKTEAKNNIKLQKKFLNIESDRNLYSRKANIKFTYSLINNISYKSYSNNKSFHKKVNLCRKYSPENSTRNSEKYNSSSKSKNFRLVMNKNISFLGNKNPKKISDNYKKLTTTARELPSFKKNFVTHISINIPQEKNVNNSINAENKINKIAIDKAKIFMKKMDKIHEISRNNCKKEFIKTNLLKISNIQKSAKNENKLKEIEDSSNKKNIKVELPPNIGRNLSINNQINQELFNCAVKNNFASSYNIIKNLTDNKTIYDGLLYRLIKKENKDKLIAIYFQITKNIFKYFNRLYRSKSSDEKPLAQIDIRVIKKIEILDLNFVDSELIKEYKIKFIFRIILKNKNESFFFAVNEKKTGDDCINILNLLIQFYTNEEKLLGNN